MLIKRWSLALIAAVVMAGLPGCATTERTGYRVYTLEEGVAHMYIEYPAFMDITLVTLLKEENYTMVDIYGPTARKERFKTHIWVTATHKENAPQDPGVPASEGLVVGRTMPGYRFIEQFSLEIAGFPAEELAYFYYTARTDYERDFLKLAPAPTVARYAYFINGQDVWTIGMTSFETTAERDGLYFDHLIETLKVLP